MPPMRPISQLKQAGRLLGCILLALQLTTVLPSHSYAQDYPPPVLEMVRLINQARAQRGLPLYLLNPALSQVAQNHVNDVIANGRLGHVGSDGSRVAGRVGRAGYAASQVSENWVYSRDLARGFRWWMADPPHRANILSSKFTEIGVGMTPHPNGWGQVWVVDFATAANGPAPDSILIGDPPAAAAVTAAAEPAALDGSTYVIQAGDTLDALARRLGISWQRLAEHNGITDPTLLQVGQVLEIPGRLPEAPVVTTEAAAPAPPPADTAAAPAPAEAAPAPAEAAPAPAAPAEAPAPAIKPATHTVRTGESLATIAPRYGLSWQTLADINGLDGRSVLQVGQVLRLEKPTASTPVSTHKPATVTVRKGDSLYSLAMRYRIAWQDLAKVNGLTGKSVLQVGQVLRLP